MSKTINDLEKMLDKDIEASSLSGKPQFLYSNVFIDHLLFHHDQNRIQNVHQNSLYVHKRG